MFDKKPSNFVEENETRDVPSNLFRKVLKKLNITQNIWTGLLSNYVKWQIPDGQEEGKGKDSYKITKEKRSTATSNHMNIFFKSKTLTFNKLLTGLNILKIVKVKITLEFETKDGESHKVSTDVLLKGPKEDE